MSSKRFNIPADSKERIRSIVECEFAVKNGLELLSVSENEVRVAMDLEGRRNGFMSAHGGAIFSLADQAFAVCVNKDDLIEVAMSASIRYLKPGNSRLEAVASKTKDTDKTTTVKVMVYDDNKDIIAEFEGVGYKLTK